MRREIRLALLICGFALGLPLAGGADVTQASSAQSPDDGLKLYFREADLLAMSAQKQETYNEEAPGDNPRIERAFPGAPPSIPHTTEDMLPITATENECLTCHHPDSASTGDIPFPPSHFLAPVMGKGKKNDPMVWVVKDYKKLNDLMGARYNCVMCHTQPATNVDTPKSNFIVEKIETKK